MGFRPLLRCRNAACAGRVDGVEFRGAGEEEEEGEGGEEGAVNIKQMIWRGERGEEEGRVQVSISELAVRG